MNRTFHPVALLALAALAASCAAPRHDAGSAPARVWPPPPDEPRIRFVKNIASPADIGRGPGFWKSVGHILTGSHGEREALSKPFGVALDSAGNLCITDMGNSTVCYCDFAHKRWRRWDAAGKTRFISPVAIARKDGAFFVADSEPGKVIAFDEKGRQQFIIGAPLQRPAGLAIAGDSLVVADSQAHAIFVFDLRGRLKFRFGKRGTAPGEFNFPTHVAADGRGHLFVTDSLNSRVQVFDTGGNFVSLIGSSGDTPGHFGRPKGVAADTFGHLYIADAVFDNIQVFDLAGQLLLNWGEGGMGPGEFGLPAGVAIGADNRIYVADSYNHRVQVFQYVGQP